MSDINVNILDLEAYNVNITDNEIISINISNDNINVNTSSTDNIYATITDNENILVNITGILNLGDLNRLKWVDLAFSWTEEPSYNTSITGGDVYNYIYDGTIYYRFVPSVYDSTEDKFYTTFSDQTLSGLVAIRGKGI